MAEVIKQAVAIDHIKTDTSGKVSQAPDGFIADILKKNRAIVLGDAAHEQPAIRGFFADQVGNMKKQGVTDIFLEYPREWQVELDNYMKTADKKIIATLRDKTGSGFRHPDHDSNITETMRIIDEAKKHGVAVHFMDVNVKDSPVPRYDLILKNDRTPEEEILFQEDKRTYQDRLETARHKASIEWTSFIEEKMKGRPDAKFVALGGMGHTQNATKASKDKDFDEFVAEKMGNTAYIGVYQTPDATPVITDGRASNLPFTAFKPGTEHDTPEFAVRVPAMAVKKMLESKAFATKPQADQAATLEAFAAYSKAWTDLSQLQRNAKSEDPGRNAVRLKLNSLKSNFEHMQWNEVETSLAELRKDKDVAASPNKDEILKILDSMDKSVAATKKNIAQPVIESDGPRKAPGGIEIRPPQNLPGPSKLLGKAAPAMP